MLHCHCSAAHPCSDDIMSPPGGPSSPRGQWPQMRGSIAEAAANALSKGSPRGVTPTHSNAALQQQGSATAAVAARLAKLSVTSSGLGPAPSGQIPNQGGLVWVVGLVWAGLCVCVCVVLQCIAGMRQLRWGFLARGCTSYYSAAQSKFVHCCNRPRAGLQRVDTMGQLMSPGAMKRRGLKVRRAAPACLPPELPSACASQLAVAQPGSTACLPCPWRPQTWPRAAALRRNPPRRPCAAAPLAGRHLPQDVDRHAAAPAPGGAQSLPRDPGGGD